MRSWPGLPKRPAVIQCILNGCTNMLVLVIGHLDPEISWNIPFTSVNTRIDLPKCTHISCDCQDGFPAAHGCAAAMRPTIAPNGLRVYEPARRAQAVASLLLCNRRDHRAGCRRPSDERQRGAPRKPAVIRCRNPGSIPSRCQGRQRDEKVLSAPLFR